MPAVRQSPMVDRAAGVAGSFMATSPNRRCGGLQSASLRTSAAVNASTRYPSRREFGRPEQGRAPRA